MDWKTYEKWGPGTEHPVADQLLKPWDWLVENVAGIVGLGCMVVFGVVCAVLVIGIFS